MDAILAMYKHVCRHMDGQAHRTVVQPCMFHFVYFGAVSETEGKLLTACRRLSRSSCHS